MKGLHRTAHRCRNGLYMGIRSAVLIFLFFGSVAKSIAQTVTQASAQAHLNYDVASLTIGDKVPNIVFHNVLNYKSKTANLSDFQGKLVILDMWSVLCSSCISNFPKMEKLQADHKDKIQILLVNPDIDVYNSQEKIKSVLDKLKTRTGFYPSLPIPIHDGILNHYFPHESVPHYVWIDGNKNVIAITGSVEVNSENVAKFLAGEKLTIPVKDDLAFDSKKPLLVDGNGGESGNFVMRSVFTRYNGSIGFDGGIRIDDNNRVIGAYMLNVSLRHYVYEAFSDILKKYHPNRVIIESDNAQIYSSTFDKENAYCYDLVVPPTTWELFDKYEYLREDLKRFFNISVREEKIKKSCLIVSETENLKDSKSGKEDLSLDDNNIKKYIRGVPVNQVIQYLDWLETPIIDETKSTKLIDINFSLNADLNDPKVVIKALRDAGFKVQQEERLLEVAVISDTQKRSK